MFEQLYLENDGKLNDRTRKQVMQVIIQYTTRNKIWVPQEKYKDIFCMIKNAYPEESIDLWYIPRSKANSNPNGIIFRAFKYEREKLNEVGLRKNSKKQDKLIENSNSFLAIEENSESIRQQLITRSEPWERVTADWKATWPLRRNEINNKTLIDIFTRWPLYKKTKGKELVRISIL